MGYTIRYCPESAKRYPGMRAHKWKKFVRLFVIFFVAMMLLSALKFRTVLLRWMLPGDPDVTAQALENLFSNMEQKDAASAITAFCREIIDNADS